MSAQQSNPSISNGSTQKLSWEYYIENLYSATELQRLNELGAAGWELVQVKVLGQTMSIAWFKRLR
jgi:hypothetical protein